MAVFSNQVITVTDAVATLTEPTSGWPSSAIISVETAPIRITLDGNDPNNPSKNGILLASGAIIEVSGDRDLGNFKAIKSGDTNASISVNYQQKD